MFTKTEAFPGESFYTQVPTHWLRDPFLGSPAKAVLSYWQSHAIGYRVTIEQTIAEMAEGRDYVYAAVRDALDRGYLKRLQGRGGKGRFGAVEYTYGPAAFMQQYVRNWGRRPDGSEGPIGDATAGQATAAAPPASVDNSAVPGVSAGRTASGPAGSGQTGSGPAGYGATGYGPTASGESDTKKINPLKDQPLSSYSSEVDQKDTPSGSVSESLPREPERVPEESRFSEDEKRALADAAEKAVAARSGRNGWTLDAVRAAMLAQLDAGRGVAEVVKAIGTVAADQAHKFPGRVEFVLNAPPPAPPAAEWAVGPVRYVSPGTPMCRQHRGEPEIRCGKCKVDRLAAKLPDEPVHAALKPITAPEGLIGAARARWISQQSKTGAVARQRRHKPLKAVSGPAPSPIGDLLGTVAASIGARS